MPSIKRFSSRIGALLLSIALLFSFACAEQIGDIDRTQPNKLKKEHFNLRFQAATNQLEKPSRVREVRRSIAQIKTLQTERSRSAAK